MKGKKQMEDKQQVLEPHMSRKLQWRKWEYKITNTNMLRVLTNKLDGMEEQLGTVSSQKSEERIKKKY